MGGGVFVWLSLLYLSWRASDPPSPHPQEPDVEVGDGGGAAAAGAGPGFEKFRREVRFFVSPPGLWQSRVRLGLSQLRGVGVTGEARAGGRDTERSFVPR